MNFEIDGYEFVVSDVEKLVIGKDYLNVIEVKAADKIGKLLAKNKTPLKLQPNKRTSRQ